MAVVIPVFNGERFLAAAIQSVLDQSYRPFELIVVDDGSTDSSVALARSFAGARVIEQEHAGPGAARNRGVAASSGEFLAFLDADDLMPANKLELQAAYLRSHPQVGCVLGRQKLFGAPAGTVPPAFAPPISPNRHPELVGRGSLQPLSLMTRRSVFDAVGGFGTDFGEDLDWLARVFGAGVRVETIDVVVVHRRVHDRNLTHALSASRLAMFRALKGQADRARGVASAPPAQHATVTPGLVSIVIPVFNGEHVLAAAMQSVFDQSYRPFELIVVDDGSTDGSARLARTFAGARVIEQEHAGPDAARNRGVAASSGEFLAFLDADDELPADKLELQIGYLREHPEVGRALGRRQLLVEPQVRPPI